jgi:uncharacterized membrane protein YhaH (DUF805 family)
MNSATFEEIEQYRARPALFTLHGRLGRARWVLYGMGAVCAAFLVMVLAGYGLYLSGRLGRMLYQVLFYAMYFFALPIFFVQLTVRRAHDFNVEGWLALLLLVPIVNMMFAFIPGTRGENLYGPELEPESLATNIAAVVAPLLFIAAFLSATTIPPQQAEQPAAYRAAPVHRSTPPPAAPAGPATPLRPYIP